MARAKLTHRDLGSLANGQAGRVIDSALKQACNDLYERGEEDGKPRKVTIQIALVQKRGVVVADVQAKVGVPDYLTDATIMDMRGKSGEIDLYFQEHNADGADQGTFEELDKD